MLEADGRGTDAATPNPGGMERAFIAHMAGLRASFRRHQTECRDAAVRQIEDLFAAALAGTSGGRVDWTIPNEIEILLVQLMQGPDLDVALDSAFLTAQSIGVPSAPALARRRDDAAGDDAKRALLCTVLRDTHNRYAARRSERVERSAVARRLARLGLWLTGTVVLVLVMLGVEPSLRLGDASYSLTPSVLAQHNTIVCVFFGILGAYLSRLIAFQNGASQLSFDDLENGYARHYIFVRLLVGGLSALVVYFVIAGRLIGGELFPEPAPTTAGGFGTLWQGFDGDSYSGPTANFAKLIIWSFIAGFSERFLPDRLTTLEAKSRT